MGKEARGELRRGAKGWTARITIVGRTRRDFALPHFALADELGALERTRAMAAMAARIRAAGRADLVEPMMKEAARAHVGESWAEVEKAADALCGPIKRVGKPGAVTFAVFAEKWTSGELARLHPDHVKVKDTFERDEMVLEKYVNPKIGPVHIHLVTLEACDQVMAALPSRLSAASRRHVAQVMHRVMTLAVYPGRLLQASPIPKGWLPKLAPRKAMACLYPDEDRALLACITVPLILRLCFGVLSREGMRRSELVTLRWRDVDLQRGVVTLDRTKTDEPRAWVLDPGVVRALKAWKALYRPDAETDDLVLQDLHGEMDVPHMAAALRRSLEAAGVDRPELFESTTNRQRVRAHDLRATFVTVSLANGRTESWVADRTGHTTSEMINAYRRQARTWAEANQGELAALDQAIPELSAADGKEAPPSGSDRKPIAPDCPKPDPSKSENTVCTRRDLNPARGGTGTPLLRLSAELR